MDTVRTYMDILTDTLRKKEAVLEEIRGVTAAQGEILAADDFDEDAFQETLREKERLLADLGKLDQGFEQVYARVSDALKGDKEAYREPIQEAQRLIREVMDLGVGIQAAEEQNKERFTECVAAKRGQIRDRRASSQAAAHYYRNMPNVHQAGQSYFLDQEK